MTVDGRPEETYRVRAYTPWHLTARSGATFVDDDNGTDLAMTGCVGILPEFRP